MTYLAVYDEELAKRAMELAAEIRPARGEIKDLQVGLTYSGTLEASFRVVDKDTGVSQSTKFPIRNRRDLDRAYGLLLGVLPHEEQEEEDVEFISADYEMFSAD